MNRFLPSRVAAGILAVTAAFLPATAGACAACMGDVNSKFAPATNDAIFVMLGVIGFVFTSFAGFAFYLLNRPK